MNGWVMVVMKSLYYLVHFFIEDEDARFDVKLRVDGGLKSVWAKEKI